MNTTKKCFKCGEEKPLEEFYKHPQMADGRVGKCKACNKADNIANRAAKLEQYRVYEADRAQLKHRKDANRKYVVNNRDAVLVTKRKSAEKHPKAKKCAQAVANALRRGRLHKTPCIVCGHFEVEGHHPDYDYPLQVVWLCKNHHTEIHKQFWVAK